MASMIRCAFNTERSPHSHFSMDEVLIDIGKYFKCLKTELAKQTCLIEEKDKRISELQQRNDRLNKAVNTLKVQCQDAITTQPEQCDCKRRRTESPGVIEILEFNDEIAIPKERVVQIDSVMDAALNETALNANLPLSNEIITATEVIGNNKEHTRARRRGGLQHFLKKSPPTIEKLTHDENLNTENRQPKLKGLSLTSLKMTKLAAAKSLPIADKRPVDGCSKDQRQMNETICQTQPKSGVRTPKQSYLIPHGKKREKILVLSKTSQSKHNFDDDNDGDGEEVFGFSPTQSFLVNTPNADRSDCFIEDANIFSTSNVVLDRSVILMPNPTLKPITIDDSSFQSPHKPIKIERAIASQQADSEDSLAEFEMPEIAKTYSPSTKIVLKTRTAIKTVKPEKAKSEPTSSSPFFKPNLKIKQEKSSISAQLVGQVINPIFQHTESTEEMDDCFNTEQEGDIDVNMLTCEDCKLYLQMLGGSMRLEQKKEYLSKCGENHRQRQIPSTPEGFWNPHLNSFSQNDPRNVTLIDPRWQQKRN